MLWKKHTSIWKSAIASEFVSLQSVGSLILELNIRLPLIHLKFYFGINYQIIFNPPLLIGAQIINKPTRTMWCNSKTKIKQLHIIQGSIFSLNILSAVIRMVRGSQKIYNAKWQFQFWNKTDCNCSFCFICWQSWRYVAAKCSHFHALTY